jgi:hypothetical protein
MRSPGFDLSILPNADPDQPGCATDPKTLTLPGALHHPGTRPMSARTELTDRRRRADTDPEMKGWIAVVVVVALGAIGVGYSLTHHEAPKRFSTTSYEQNPM